MKHVILGAGPAGVVAAETLRKLDAAAEIVLVGDEAEPPYSRMAIPYLLCDNINEAGTYLRKADDYFARARIEVKQGRAESADAKAKSVRVGGAALSYDKLLVATGATPMTPPIAGIDHAKVTHCWTLADARKITAGVRKGAPVVLIGAGFIGCIILEALVSAGVKLTVIETGDRMVPRMLDAACGKMLQTWCEKKGVRVLTGATVQAIEDAGDKVNVAVKGGEAIAAELVIAATGVRANADFLKDSGVKLEDHAVVIDKFMASSQPDIYAAGDVAHARDFTSGEYSVQAIQPTAVEHARIAAHNMHAHASVEHGGSVSMNVLDTIGLISASFGNWQGVAGGDSATLKDEGGFRYINLQFDGARLVGANTLGMTQHIGVLRGLIRGRFDLGVWKRRLCDNPLNLMEAYLAVAHG